MFVPSKRVIEKQLARFEACRHGYFDSSVEFVIANKRALALNDDPSAPAAYGKPLFVFTTDNPHINDGDII